MAEQNKNNGPIGVFDSGVGGLTVLGALERALPTESFVYLGDTARVPYGPKSAPTVQRYAAEAGHFFQDKKAKLVVAACNTVSATGLDALKEAQPNPVIGVIEPGAARAAKLSKTGRIGVIGTRATIDSAAYTREIKRRRDDAHVVAMACPLFVPLAEEGWADDEIAEAIAHRYLKPLERERIDTLVLGCTHYPLLRDTIGRVLGKEVTLVDSAESVAAEVRTLFPDGDNSAPGDRSFFVTDDPGRFRVVAERFLSRPIGEVQSTPLGDA